MTGEVVGYCRYSSNNQREESISAQKRFIMGYAQNCGLNIAEWYVDEAYSGKTDRRPAFLQMIEAAKAGKISKVIVHKLDRFSRSMTDTVNYRGLFRDLDVELISVAEDFEKTPAGNLMMTMIAAFNQYYVENLSTEVMKGMTETAIQGMWTGGKPPLGYDVGEDRHLVINPEEAAVVRTIFEIVAAGYGYSRIVDALNEAGCRTKAGNLFGKNSIHDLLDNEKYIGHLIFNRRSSAAHDGKTNSHKYKPREKWIVYPDGCPVIIPQALWDRVQTLRRLNLSGRHKAKHPYLLSGRIRCAHCGSSMHGNTWKGKDGLWRDYRCGRKERQHACSASAVCAGSLECYAMQFIEEELLMEGRAQVIADEVNRRIQAAQVDNKDLLIARENLKRLDKEMRNLSETIARIGYEDVLGEHLQDIKGEIKVYTEKVRMLEEKSTRCRITPREVKARLEQIFGELEPPEGIHTGGAHNLMGFLIGRITVGETRILIEISVEFTLKDEDKTTVRYECARDISRRELYECFPSRCEQDDTAVMQALWALKERYFPLTGKETGSTLAQEG